MAADDLADIVGCFVAPAALYVAERPFRRNVCLADGAAEGKSDLGKTAAEQCADGEISRIDGYSQLVFAVVAEIEDRLRRSVDKIAEALVPVAQDKEVVAAVHIVRVLRAGGGVGGECGVFAAALVYAEHRFAGAVNLGIIGYRAGKHRSPLADAERKSRTLGLTARCKRLARQMNDQRAGIERLADHIFFHCDYL